jgi:AraC family transcriptional regulator
MDIEQSIYEAALYIYSAYDQPLTIADIAAQVYLSPSYFSALFRILTGYTVKNYLNRYRLFRAASDLICSKKPIVEIAYVNGFSSQQAFTKSFSQMYGTAPAQYRMQCPPLDPFPPDYIWKERKPNMELIECFENVKFMHREAYTVIGVEVDINMNIEHGTDPISSAWDLWNSENLSQMITDQAAQGVTFGITHSVTADNTGKYITCTEVNTLDNLPIGLIGRRFGGSEVAVFSTTLAIIWTGEFWRTFYTKWLPQSIYNLPDVSLPAHICTFDKYPPIEVYGNDWKDEQSLMQIYVPVVKKQ